MTREPEESGRGPGPQGKLLPLSEPHSRPLVSERLQDLPDGTTTTDLEPLVLSVQRTGDSGGRPHSLSDGRVSSRSVSHTKGSHHHPRYGLSSGRRDRLHRKTSNAPDSAGRPVCDRRTPGTGHSRPFPDLTDRPGQGTWGLRYPSRHPSTASQNQNTFLDCRDAKILFYDYSYALTSPLAPKL